VLAKRKELSRTMMATRPKAARGAVTVPTALYVWRVAQGCQHLASLSVW